MATSQSGKFSDIGYDFRNLPVHFYMDGGAKVIANYNADACPEPRLRRQRILKELKGGAWQFYVKDGAQTLAVIDQDGLSHINLFGNSVFGRIEANSGTISTSNARRYYITDHLGSTRAVVDDGGNVLETFDYYPFGLLMPQRHTSSPGTIEKFTGKERDEALGLDYFGARYYDPAFNRWLSVDPLASKYPSLSPYNYVANNPVNAFDPDGRLIIFVNGIFFNNWKKLYWGNTAETWSNLLKDPNMKFFDGSGGGAIGMLFTLGGTLSSQSRRSSGYNKGRLYAKSIFNSLGENETIKIISHSMGTAYSRGLVQALKEYAKKVLKMSDEEIEQLFEFQLDIAPYGEVPFGENISPLFSKNRLDALKSNLKNTFQASGDSDYLAGDDPVRGKNVIQVTTPDGTTHDLEDYSIEELMNFINKHLNN